MPQAVSLEEGAKRLRLAGRVSVIGCSGGGKSTLSMELARILCVEYICMDRAFFWLPGWVMRERSEQRRLIAEAVANDRWVMDGTNPSNFDIRLPRTDVLIWVRMPRWLCLKGVLGRWMRYYGRTRPEMTPDCPEKMDRAFLRYVWTFERKHAPVITEKIDLHGRGLPVIVLKSRRDTSRLLDLLRASS